MIRSADELARQEAEVLAEQRGRAAIPEAVAVLPRPGGVVAPAIYGRVDAVVVADDEFGPHLVVVPQVWSGLPPAVSDADGEMVRCWPSPNRVVGDYTAGEYVRICAAYGAMMAERLA